MCLSIFLKESQSPTSDTFPNSRTITLVALTRYEIVQMCLVLIHEKLTRVEQVVEKKKVKVFFVAFVSPNSAFTSILLCCVCLFCFFSNWRGTVLRTMCTNWLGGAHLRKVSFKSDWLKRFFVCKIKGSN